MRSFVTVREHTDNVRTDNAHAILMSDPHDFIFKLNIANFTET